MTITFGSAATQATPPPPALASGVVLTFGVAEDSTNNPLDVIAGFNNANGNPGGEPMVIAAFTQPSNGTVALATGNSSSTYYSIQNPLAEYLTFTPTKGVTASSTFSVEVCDQPAVAQETTCVLVTVNLQIAAVNHPPVANDDLASTPLNTAVTTSVLTNDSDPDAGDTLSVVSVVSQGLHGVATVVPGNQITYTPTAGFTGTDKYVYMITDTHGSTATATVYVWVANDPPVLLDDAHSTPEDTPDDINVLANDATAMNCGIIFGYTPCLQIVSVGQPKHGNVTVNLGVSTPGVVHYIPNANWNGIDTFTYTACTYAAPGFPIPGPPAELGQCATATVTETVEAVNDPPVGRDDLAVMAQGDQSVVVDVLANDSDEDVNDTLGSSAPQTIYVNAITTQGTFGTATVEGTGPTSKVKYTPNNPLQIHNDQFQYQVCDTYDGPPACTTATVNIIDAASNAGAYAYDQPPVAVDDVFSTSENTPLVNQNVTGNDSDADGSFAVTQMSQPTGGAGSVVSLPGGNFTFTPTPNWNGNTTFTYEICDIFNKCDTATVTITVGAVNYAPIARDDIASTPELNAPTFPVGGLQIDVLANDTDPDGDPMTVNAITTAPTHGTAFVSGNKVVYFPTAGYVGTDNLTYQVCDTAPLCSTANVLIFVSKVNGAPVALNDSAFTDEDTSVSIYVLLNDFDPNGDPIYISSVTWPSHGEVVVNGTHVDYTPDPNYHGLDNFDYVVCDNTGACSTAHVQVSVKSVLDAPVANEDLYITSEDTPISLDVLANDTDADNLPPAADNAGLKVCGITLAPTSGLAIAIINAGLQTIQYTPGHHFFGHDTLQYKVCDVNGLFDTATDNIIVLPVNHAPDAIDDIATSPAGDPVAINVKANDSDEDGDPLTVKSVTGASNGTVTIDQNNDVYYVPNYGFKGQDTFTYTVCDTSDACDTANVTVSVNYDQPGSIEGHVYMDLNGNGHRDAGEPDLQGVRVSLYLAGPDGVFNTADDVLVSEGTIQSPYEFDNLPAATYQIRIDQSTVPQGLVYTEDPVAPLDGQAIVAMGFGKNFSDMNFGFGPGADLPETI